MITNFTPWSGIRRSKGQFRLPESFPFKTRLPVEHKNESWIHRRSEMSFDTDSYDEAESGYIDFEQPTTTPVK